METKPYGYIYLIRNLINDKVYIGQSTVLKKIHRYYGGGRLIRKSINLHGKENFEKYILCYCDNQYDLDKKEIEYIKSHDCNTPNGYNIEFGGNGLGKTSDDTIYKISLSCKGLNKGKIVSDETKEKMSKAQKGKMVSDETKELLSKKRKGKKFKPHSNETKEKISKAHIGKKRKPFTSKAIENMSKAQKGEKNGMFNKKHSDETKEKIRESQKGKTLSDETKEKMSKAHIGKPTWNKGKKASPESIRKREETKKRNRELKKLNNNDIPQSI